MVTTDVSKITVGGILVRTDRQELIDILCVEVTQYRRAELFDDEEKIAVVAIVVNYFKLANCVNYFRPYLYGRKF